MPISSILLNRIRNNDPTLILCNFAMQNLEGADIQIFIEALLSNTYLKTLDLSYQCMGDAEAKALVLNIGLECLYLIGSPVYANRIADEGAKALAANKTLRLLDLENNLVGDAGAAAFANNITLTTLNLSRNLIGILGAQALARNRTLKILNLGANLISSEGINAFAQNTTLISLGLGGSTLSIGELENAGAQALALSSTLKALNLSRNKISNEGAKALAQNQSLTALNIDNNPISEEGMIALIENPSLRVLVLPMIRHVRQDGDGQEGTLKALLKAATANTNLIQLYLPLNITLYQFKQDWENALEEVTTRNRQIRLDRREWMEKALIIAADRNNTASTSAFAQLPRELAVSIISLVGLLYRHSLGKTDAQLERCSHFLFEQILTIMAHLRQGENFQIKEKVNPGKPSQFRLRFFKPPIFSEQEIDQETTALDMDYRA